MRAERRILDGGTIEVRTAIGTTQAALWDGLVIEKGRRVNIPIAWISEAGPVDLSTGYTASLVVDDGDEVVLTLTQAAGITLAAGIPNISLGITAAASAAMTWRRGYYLLTLTHTASLTAVRLLEGACRVA